MTMEVRKKVALAYVRVSTEEQADGGSPDTQRAAIQAYADQNGYTIAKDDWFEDLGVSAKTAKRPDLQRMLETVERRKGEIDAVIIYNSTRISRNMLTFFCDIFARLRKNGVALKSATEYYGEPDDPTGDVAMILGVMVGEIDNKTKSKFTHDNMKNHLNESGWWMGGRTPLGFKVKRIPVEGKQRDDHQKSHAVLVPDDTNDIASKLTFLLNRFSEGDLKPHELLDIAHKMDVRGYKGDILAQSTLDTILVNEIYAGWHKSKTMTENKPVKMNFDGLISWETFEKNQRILNDSTDRPYTKADDSLYPLKKTACCAICGTEMDDTERRQ